MKSIVIGCILMASLVSVGCTRGGNAMTPTAMGSRRMDVYIERGKDQWISTNEMDRIARLFAKQRGIDFDFADTATTVMVPAGNPEKVASVQYSRGIGHPMLIVDIDRNAEVTGHKVGMAVDELRVGSGGK